MTLLFTYGTLRRDCTSPMDALLRAHATWIGQGTCQGRLYLVDYYPGLVSSDDPNDRVVGDLYRLRQPAVVLDQLDAYEGCGPEAEHAYIREWTQIHRSDGPPVEAWMYRYKHPIDGLRHLIDGDFLHHRPPTQ